MGWQPFAIAGAVVAWAAWMFVCLYLDAKLGGWWSLAEKYPCPEKQTVGVESWSLESVELANGGSSYRLLTITASSIGMKVSMPPVLRLLYPDLFLPWKDVTASRERGWLWDRVHLTFSAVPDVPVTIWAPLEYKILASAGPVWPSPQQPARKTMPNS